MSVYNYYGRITRILYKVLNFICVVCLAIELVAVIVMVCGRYIFNNVPRWCDQMSTLALIWMAIISITLAVHDERHMRVELIDKALSKKAVDVLKYCSNTIITVFCILMARYGFTLVSLNKGQKLSGFRVPSALQYIPLVICGIAGAWMSLFCIVRRIVEARK